MTYIPGSGSGGGSVSGSSDVALNNVADQEVLTYDGSVAKWRNLPNPPSVKLTGDQTIDGTKTFSSAPIVPDSSFSVAKISAVGTRDATTLLAGDGSFAARFPLGSAENPVTDASALRPSGIAAVWWRTSVNPANAAAGDWVMLVEAVGTPTLNASTSISSNGFTSNWTSVENASDYLVQRRTGTTAFATVATVTGTSYAHSGLAASTAYDVRIIARIGTSEGAPSNTVSTSTSASSSSTTVYSQTFGTDNGTWRPKTNANAPTHDTARLAEGSLRWTAAATGATEVEGPTTPFAVTAGTVHSINAAISNADSVAHSCHVAIMYYDSAGNYLTAHFGASLLVDPGTSFTALPSLVSTAPSGATLSRVFAGTGDSVTAGAAFYLDAVTVTK